MNKLIQFISTLVFLAIGSLLMGQPLVHSHNDYFQKLPLHTAVGAGAHSIEIDIIFSNNRLMVAHDQRDLPTAKTIDHLYFKPLINIYNNDTNALKDVQIMIDIKNEPQKVLIELEKVVNALPEFKKMLLTHKIKPLVISGSKPKSYQGWPSYILFDHQRLEDIDQIPLDKVAFFSFSFRNFTNWNGKGRLTKKDEQALSNYIEKVHALGKKIRFWATPDTKSSWYSLSSIGVDYINTDQPWECAAYLRSLSKNILKREPMQSEGEVKAYQKATINTPTQNVIFMVGDGNGLGHIAATYIAKNGNLNIATSKHVGLIYTNSYDDLITDSAAGGTALATGQKTNNRHIGVDQQGQKIANIMEVLPEHYQKAILTTDEITGATPSAYYAHVSERDDAKAIINDLVNSNINLIVGAGKKHLKHIEQYKSQSSLLHNEIPSSFINDKVNIVALENSDLPYFNQGRGDFLTQSFSKILYQLKANDQPFFFMVENSHIDNSGHHNSPKDVISEVLDFDKCVGEAIEFVKNNPNTTLIVLADHETGGITLPHGSNDHVAFSFSTDDHTAAPVPVFAWGINASIFQGMYQNIDIFHKILNILGLD